MPDVELGRLASVSLRDIWRLEAADFTPWLHENLDALAEAIGLDALSPVDTEVKVGAFSLDILAQTPAGDFVAIENQLEASDHQHLGQCLTYAAGVDASIVVWVVPALREEHRAALDWLNEHTDESLGFFGVELSAVRIDDSRPALRFVAKSLPNDWQKRARQSRTDARPELETWAEFETRVLDMSGTEALASVRALHEHWASLGGEDDFGRDSWFPVLKHERYGRTSIWPIAVYAAGSVEVVFQHLAKREPFDDMDNRVQLQRRLNEVISVRLPDDRLDKRPSFPLSDLADQKVRLGIQEVLTWFAGRVREAGPKVP